jgi:hypothetical protein
LHDLRNDPNLGGALWNLPFDTMSKWHEHSRGKFRDRCNVLGFAWTESEQAKIEVRIANQLHHMAWREAALLHENGRMACVMQPHESYSWDMTLSKEFGSMAGVYYDKVCLGCLGLEVSLVLGFLHNSEELHEQLRSWNCHGCRKPSYLESLTRSPTGSALMSKSAFLRALRRRWAWASRAILAHGTRAITMSQRKRRSSPRRVCRMQEEGTKTSRHCRKLAQKSLDGREA